MTAPFKTVISDIGVIEIMGAKVQPEPGYYWTQMPTDNAPKVREWQRYYNLGYSWAECGDGDRDEFPGLTVISERLEPPE